METKSQTSREYFRTLQIIFYSLIAGQVIFGLVAFFIHQSMTMNPSEKELRDILKFVIPVIMLITYLISNSLFKKNIKTAPGRKSLAEKMNDYRAALVIRYAIMESASFLLTVDS